MAYLYRHIRLDKNEPFYIGIVSDNVYKISNDKLPCAISPYLLMIYTTILLAYAGNFILIFFNMINRLDKILKSAIKWILFHLFLNNLFSSS